MPLFAKRDHKYRRQGLEYRIRRAAFALSAFLVVGLGTALFLYQITLANREQLKTHSDSLHIIAGNISSIVYRRVDNIELLSSSPLIWTAISDSVSRDAYLRPFLTSLNSADGDLFRVSLFDYKGRWIAGDRALLHYPGQDVKELLDADRTAPMAHVLGGADPRALLVFPVHYPYTDDVIGILVGNLSLKQGVQQPLETLPPGYGYQVNLGDSEVIAGRLNDKPHYNPVDEVITSTRQPRLLPLHISLFGTESPWWELSRKYAGIYLVVAAILIWSVWRISGLMARRLTERLNSLSSAVSGRELPAAEDIPLSEEENDEIAMLATTLRSSLQEQARITQGLESLVAERTHALAESQALYQQYFEENAAIKLVVDPESRCIVEANKAAVEYYGYSLDRLTGMKISDINTLSEEEVHQEMDRAVREGRKYFVFQHRLASGELRDVEVYAGPVTVNGRKLLFAIIHDITDRRRAEARLRLTASVFTSAREAIMITDAQANIIDVNEAFTTITGYTRAEVLGRNPRLLASGHQIPEFYRAMWHELGENRSWSGEIWNRRKDGEAYAELLTISAVTDSNGVIQHYVGLFSDITAAKEHERQLAHIAHYDALTGLPNRVLLQDRLRQAMAMVQRRRTQLAVVYLDLDGFKHVNDTYGHDAGDKLLTGIAARMKGVLRDSDTLARLGGDEFVAVLLDLTGVEECVPLLTRMLGAAAESFVIEQTPMQVSASIGVTLFPQEDDVDADQLLRQADQAMYQAKLSGKNRYHLFDDDQDRSVRGHHESLERIRAALSNGEFELYYQPKVNMREGRVVGLEALIRWNHPEQGTLLPAAFLPVIESHPLSIEVDDWVLETTMRQIETWRAAGLRMPVSVNVGASQLQRVDFVERLRDRLARHPDVGPGDLGLEVLETSALEDINQASHVIEACQELGVDFSLDDFGTGYSSLTYLKRLPANHLKIDQSFVRDMLDDSNDLAILEGVLGLASSFHRDAIAEGMETREHGEMLLRLGCTTVQGYGIARPMPAEQVLPWLASWQPDPRWATIGTLNVDDLPMLYAHIEHRAWVEKVADYLHSRRIEPPPINIYKCAFGQWLHGQAHSRYEQQPAFAALERSHHAVHELTHELVALKAAGQQRVALERLGELYQLRDKLLAQLHDLLEASSCIGSNCAGNRQAG